MVRKKAPLPPITGSANITLNPVAARAAGPPHTYLATAKAFVSGAKIVAAANPGDAISLAFLSAQAAECGLKAYLSRDGRDERLKNDDKLRHDLVKLWKLASSEGLAIAAAPPSWLTMLGKLHRKPYHLRYSTGVHGLGIPAPQPMTDELATLVEQVTRQLI